MPSERVQEHIISLTGLSALAIALGKSNVMTTSLYIGSSLWRKSPGYQFLIIPYEPRHDKTKKVTVRPAKTQISLGIRLV